MNTSTYLLELIKCIMPSLFAVAIVFINDYFSNKIRNKDVLQHRIDAFYKPACIDYYKNHVYLKNINNKHDFISIHKKTLEIILKNIDCAEQRTQDLIIDYLFSLEHLPFDEDMIQKRYFETITQIFIEYRQICYKLKLPKPSGPFGN